MTEAREEFTLLARVSDQRLDVAKAALWIAAEEYPGLDVQGYLDMLDDLSARARKQVDAARPVSEQVAALNRFLFEDCGFAGNHDDYYDPRNSFLNEVMDRRLGIPISLSIVYCEVARRLGLPIHGVGFPGHFLCKHSGSPEIIIDPFFSTILDRDECASRLRDVLGSHARLESRWLEPATPREILVRLLSNLKQIYVERNDTTRALGCSDRLLLLVPDAPRELRDRGLLYHRLECFGPALRDLERYLRLAPRDSAADVVRRLIPDLQRQASQLQ